MMCLRNMVAGVDLELCKDPLTCSRNRRNWPKFYVTFQRQFFVPMHDF